MESNCIFCKIIEGKIPSQKVFENENVIGFKDISPQAPIHYVFIPKRHVESLAHINEQNSEVVRDVLVALTQTAKKEGIEDKGYRTIINTNEWGGQTVFHLHAHLLAGKKLPGGLV